MAEQENAVATEPTKERQPQTVTIADIGPARKRLTIEVPPERITKKIEEQYTKLKGEAAIPGFRRGRAPHRLVEKRFGESIRTDVRAQILGEAYTQAVEEEKLDVVGEPEIKELEALKLPESGPLVFNVEVEVSPKVEVPDFTGLQIKKTKYSIAEADVQKEIDALALRFGSVSYPDDVTVEPGDFLAGELTIRAGLDANDEAEEVFQNQNITVLVPKTVDGKSAGNVAGILVEDLGAKLVGKKEGDAVRISLQGPQNHENDKIKDKPITLVLTIRDIGRATPATMPAVTTALGLADEKTLRERTQGLLDQTKQRQQRANMHEQVCDWLVKTVNLELPAGLTGRQAERVIRRQQMDLAYRGMNETDIAQKIAELRSGSEDVAVKQLKLFFVLDQAARDMQVDVTEQEINSRIYMLAMQQGRRPEKLRQEMVRSGEISALYLSLREQKTLDLILEKATVTEVDG